jgi:hypothetical protein
MKNIVIIILITTSIVAMDQKNTQTSIPKLLTILGNNKNSWNKLETFCQNYNYIRHQVIRDDDIRFSRIMNNNNNIDLSRFIIERKGHSYLRIKTLDFYDEAIESIIESPEDSRCNSPINFERLFMTALLPAPPPPPLPPSTTTSG